jgi:excisionase family DNA binding protein
MTTPLLEATEPAAPTTQDIEIARTSSPTLARLADTGEAVRLHVSPSTPDSDGGEVVLPASVIRLLSRILAAMATGNSVAVIPSEADLTTQQAADLLGVSRPYLIRLLEAEHIPYHKVGAHRRIRLTDLLQYREKRTARLRALEELAAQAQELNMGYGP